MAAVIASLILFANHADTSMLATSGLGEGARPTGMGKAFVAVADDANALYYNSAGIADFDRIVFTSTYTSLWQGLKGLMDGFVGIVVPLPPDFSRYGTPGLSLHYFGQGDSGVPVSGTYSEMVVALSYAADLYKLADVMDGFCLGLKLKYLKVNYGVNNSYTDPTTGESIDWISANPYFNGRTGKSGFTADLDMLYHLSSRFGVGLALENLIPANMAVGEGQKDNVPVNLRLGASFQATDALLTAAEGDIRAGQVKGNGGAEYVIKFAMGRSDLRLVPRAGISAGSNKYMNLAGGLGVGVPFSFGDIILDYTFLYRLNVAEGTGNDHRISLSWIGIKNK